jgi:hypothetical protein
MKLGWPMELVLERELVKLGIKAEVLAFPNGWFIIAFNKPEDAHLFKLTSEYAKNPNVDLHYDGAKI